MIKTANLRTFGNCAAVGRKTTLLREIARLASNDGFNVCVIDERREIAGAVKGVSGLDLGKSVDVITGVKKLKAYECAIRSMNPDVVVTDEIYGAEEVDAVLDAMRAGVKVAASLHATGVSDLKNTVYEKLQRAMDITVVLTKRTESGKSRKLSDVKRIKRRAFNGCVKPYRDCDKKDFQGEIRVLFGRRRFSEPLQTGNIVFANAARRRDKTFVSSSKGAFSDSLQKFADGLPAGFKNVEEVQKR